MENKNETHRWTFVLFVTLISLFTIGVACTSAVPKPTARTTNEVAPKPKAKPAETVAPAKALTKDTPMTTVEGNTFIAPKGWRVSVRGPSTILHPPEDGSNIALIDLRAKDAKEALAKAWEAYKPDASWPLMVVNESAGKNGWSEIQANIYQTSPNERRRVVTMLQKANDIWTAIIYDMANAVGEKRSAQIALILDRLHPKGHVRESFAGKKAHTLDKTRIEELVKFVGMAQKKLGIPGISFGLIQEKEVVFANGFGFKELGKKGKPDADTLYMVASNTKALTTLLLAKLVDEKKLTWETPVTSLLPIFKLGDPDTTRQVLVKHLVCACTGMPRQDLEWLFEFGDATPETIIEMLGTFQPTSKFGELFQYSNILAGAGGFVGGHVEYPKLKLGQAYDKAMDKLVFGPLKMKSTTFNYPKALKGNHASPHSPDLSGKPVPANMKLNWSILPARPAGAAWSNVPDMLKYVALELDKGLLPSGKRYISEEALMARREPQISIGNDSSYGMGLMVNITYGIPVIHHGGDLLGFHSDMMWLPEHGVGAVVLTNGAPGWIVRDVFRRKLLEVLFDGRPEADAQVVASGNAYFEQIAAISKRMTVPADPNEATKLAPHYSNKALGEITVSRKGDATIFDFGEWKSEMASQKNPDGTISFLTTAPGVIGMEFVVKKGDKRSLIIRDAQHEYIFSE